MISRSLMGDPVQRGADRPREAPLAETEAPNLVPEPYRGKCNELASVVHTLEITWRREQSRAGPAAQIAANARRVFSPSSRSSSIEIARDCCSPRRQLFGRGTSNRSWPQCIFACSILELISGRTAIGLAHRGRPGVAGEAHQPVVGGVLVRLAACRNGKGGVDESVDRAPRLDDELPNVD